MTGLKTEQIPECLNLNELECSLIARNIIFLKLFKLPVSRWSAVKDKVINVPVTENDLEKTLSSITVLPRNRNEAGLIPVQLKRKLSYKNVVSESFVNPQKLIAALQHLKKAGHPGYQNVTVKNNYIFDLDCSKESSSEHSSLSDSSDEDWGISLSQTQAKEKATMMIDDHPDMRLITNTTSNIIQQKQRRTSSSLCPIAPGEGKIPTNLLRDENWDVNAFPNLHPSGKYGLDFQRKLKLTPQQYFNQRLLNCDKKFATNIPYVFASVYFVERYQLEQQISVSCQKGQMQEKGFVNVEDGFSVFDKIPGTPRYWLQKRNEMIARLEQLGPFQFFFTLSMADKRWEENFVSLLAQKGCTINFLPSSKGNSCFEADLVLVNGIPLHDFLAHENQNDLLRENILTLTRNFDHRVKSFMKHIVRGPNSPMHVKYFTYRVEFQVRGAAHVHGVLWLDLDKLSNNNILLKSALEKLSSNRTLSFVEKSSISQFVDTFVTTSSEGELKEIVSEVQTHNHTRTCTKRGGKCRFGYPRFPSEETIIAQPLKKEDFPSETIFRDQVKYYQAVLEDVRFQLEKLIECDEDLEKISIKDILFEAGISRQEYYKALSVSIQGTKVIHKRSIKDMFVNNYNTEWLRAWNGNMDLQVCLDPFAIVTYITDYYSKDESGTTNFLKEAAKQNFSSIKEKMKCLSQVFMTHRQLGQCEAFYRILPSLHLSESNVKCKFVHSGFPCNRSKFLRKVLQQPKRLVECHESDSEESVELDLVKIPEREGDFQIMPSAHEYYANRPDYLENLCFAQFVIYYDRVPYSHTRQIKFKEGISSLNEVMKVVSWDLDKEVLLPTHIKFTKKTLGCMKLRSFPAILRFHKFKETQDCHEFYYSELLLFKPWRKEEEELGRYDFQKCSTLFYACPSREMCKDESVRETYVQILREKLFPFLCTVLKTREILESMEENNMGCLLDPETEQCNEEASSIGTSIAEDFSCRNPELLENLSPASPGESKFKRIDISDTEAMLMSCRKLVREQRCVFDIVMQFCKNYRKALSSKWPKPEPPLLLVHGGAGSGKSKLINDIAQWAEFFLRTTDNHPGQPCVLKVAPTGKAASVIQGLTLHSAFNFNFGNEFRSLSDKLKEQLRTDLSQLKILIIDEISMVKADLLYQVDSRLQEIKQSFDSFGGVSVLLFGDLMQLKPIQANWIFEAPKDSKFRLQHDVSPLWKLFHCIELSQNHRQGDDKQYADMLNRIRFGKQTSSDIEKLKYRMRNDYPSNSTFVFPTRKPVNEMNVQKLNELSCTLVILEAVHVHSSKSKFRPVVSSDGFVNNTPFLSKVALKIGARVMLTYNCDTADGLTNGSTGAVLHFAKKGDTITHVLVLFDEPETGSNARKRNPGFEHEYPMCTPIGRVSFEYSLGKLRKDHSAKAKVIQFPLVLAWAMTAHKMQGQTVKKPNSLVADLKGVFTSGQTYVILGRVQDIHQLYLLSFVDKCIKVNEKAKIEAESIKTRAINSQNNWDGLSGKGLKIICLNIRSLRKHFLDVRADSKLQQGDILCFNEIHVHENEGTEELALPGFHAYFAKKGKGAGVAMYVQVSLKVLQQKRLLTSDFQILKLSFKEFDIFGIYQSPNKNLKLLMHKLISEIDLGRDVLICGDFNFPGQKQNEFSKTMFLKGFEQYVKEPTHLQGNMLDQFFGKVKKLHCVNCFLHCPYYSDHDAVCAIFQ